MNIVHFLIDIYFAAVLGVAGLTKLDDPHFFSSQLHHQNILPKWSIGVTSKCFPYIEITLPILLLLTTSILKVLATFCILMLFFSFLIFNLMLDSKKRYKSDCGCFGKYLQQRGFNISIKTSFLQFLLAMFLVVLSLWMIVLPWVFYLVSAVLYIAAICWLAWRMWQRHRRLAKSSAPIITPSL